MRCCPGHRPLREEGYSTQLIAREAVRLINAHDAAKPLFLYVPFNAPHAPLQAPKEYLDRYKDIPFMEEGRNQPPMPPPEDIFG